MNKKMLIVCFLAAVMLTIPFTAVTGISSFSGSRDIALEGETVHLDLQEPEYNQVMVSYAALTSLIFW